MIADLERSLEAEQAEQRRLVGDLQQKEQQQLHSHYQIQMNMQTTQAQQEMIQVWPASCLCTWLCVGELSGCSQKLYSKEQAELQSRHSVQWKTLMAHQLVAQSAWRRRQSAQ